MRITHKMKNISLWGCLMVAMMFAGGCQVNSKLPEQAPLKPEPVADAATQMRNFGLTRAYYQSAEVVAGPTEWAFSIKNKTSPWIAVIADPLCFLANVGSLPIAACADPCTKPIHYEGMVLKHVEPGKAPGKDATLADPTYTGALPIPPTPQKAPKLSDCLAY